VLRLKDFDPVASQLQGSTCFGDFLQVFEYQPVQCLGADDRERITKLTVQFTKRTGTVYDNTAVVQASEMRSLQW
jgi:hypothetical protein